MLPDANGWYSGGHSNRPPDRKHTPTSVELRPSIDLVQKVQAAATLTLPVSILIFAVRSEKCYANAHGLSSDRLPAQDRLPDARRPAEARAGDSGALGGDGPLSPAARDLAWEGKIRPARRATLCQWRTSPRNRAQQDFKGRRQSLAADARQRRPLRAGLGLSRIADRVDH